MIEERIKIAKAMGWQSEERSLPWDNSDQPMTTTVWFNPHNVTDGYQKIPDPFTDANDDYAVLEWMRKNYTRDLIENYLSITVGDPIDYQIGDYARAALKAIDSDNSPRHGLHFGQEL